MNLYLAAPRAATNNDSSAAELTPADLNPAVHPIIARHFFGVEKLPPIGSMAAEIVASSRRQRAAEHLHNLGPRPVLEALAEVETGADLDRVLADFARLTPELLEATGGDLFPAAPIYEVPST